MHLNWDGDPLTTDNLRLGEILQKRTVVFQDELGMLKGMKISLHMDQNAQPQVLQT